MNKIAKYLLKKSFKEDLASQAIILMGQPASGKSTFINTELNHYFSNVPHVSAFKVLNSDSQLKKVQYNRSKLDYERLKGIEDEIGYQKAVALMSYASNDKSIIRFPLEYAEFKILKNHNDYWTQTYKKYYATYFGEREQAQRDTEELSDRKITGSHIIIIDTTGQNVSKNLQILKKTKEQGYTNSVVYLDIPVEYSIKRDEYRGKTEGRSVGESTIKSISSKLPAAFADFANSELVDRVMRFEWVGNVYKGEYVLASDKKKYPYS